MTSELNLQKYIARKISNRRKELCISLEPLAAETGLKLSKLQKLEAAQIKISSYELLLISKALGAPVGYFFPDDQKLSFIIPTESNFILTTYHQLNDQGKNAVLKYLGELKLQAGYTR